VLQEHDIHDRFVGFLARQLACNLGFIASPVFVHNFLGQEFGA